MSHQPLAGISDDYLCRIINAIGTETAIDTLEHIGIDDRRLPQEASELPNLMFFYSATFERINLRIEREKIRLKELEARQYLSVKERAKANHESITVDEINAHVTLTPEVSQLRQTIIDLTAMRDTVKGVVKALERKGFSLQLIGTIRSRENDWLRQSFRQRLEGHPDQERIINLMDSVLGSQ